MTTWGRIGCVVGFGDAPGAGLEHAASLAARLGSELFLLHVSEVRPAASPPALFAPPPVSTQAEEHASDLAAWALEAQRLGAPVVRSALIRGSPADAIVRFAAEERLDLLVVASRGRSGLRHLVVGSVAEAVVRAAPCPVLVVRVPPSSP